MPFTPEEAQRLASKTPLLTLRDLTKAIDAKIVSSGYTAGAVVPVEFDSLPLSEELFAQLQAAYPEWEVLQGRTRGDTPSRLRVSLRHPKPAVETSAAPAPEEGDLDG